MLIPTNQNIKTITDMREKALELLSDVQKLGLVYLFQHSDPKAVILSMEEYQRLYELVEDHLDEIEAKKLSQESRGKSIPLATIMKKYRQKSRV